MTVSNVSFFFTEGKNKKPPNQVFLRYMSMQQIQCFRKKQRLIQLLEALEEAHDLPGLKDERDKEKLLLAAKKILEQKESP